jgi:hypothetical protein
VWLVIGEPIRKEQSTDGLEKIMNSPVLQNKNKQIRNMKRMDTRSVHTQFINCKMSERDTRPQTKDGMAHCRSNKHYPLKSNKEQ